MDSADDYSKLHLRTVQLSWPKQYNLYLRLISLSVRVSQPSRQIVTWTLWSFCLVRSILSAIGLISMMEHRTKYHRFSFAWRHQGTEIINSLHWVGLKSYFWILLQISIKWHIGSQKIKSCCRMLSKTITISFLNTIPATSLTTFCPTTPSGPFWATGVLITGPMFKSGSITLRSQFEVLFEGNLVCYIFSKTIGNICAASPEATFSSSITSFRTCWPCWPSRPAS